MCFVLLNCVQFCCRERLNETTLKSYSNRYKIFPFPHVKFIKQGKHSLTTHSVSSHFEVNDNLVFFNPTFCVHTLTYGFLMEVDKKVRNDTVVTHKGHCTAFTDDKSQ